MAPRAARWVVLAVVASLGAASSASAQALPEPERAPRVLLLAVEPDAHVSTAAIDAVDEAVGTLPALATWARPSASCDPATADALGGQVGCLASVECARRLARRCEADYLVRATVGNAPGTDRVAVVVSVFEGRRGIATVEEHLGAEIGVELERTLRRGIERIAAGAWLAGSLEIRGPSSGLGVTVDGHDAGVAPVALSRLAVGYHQIELLAAGRVVYRGEVEVEPGVTSIVRAQPGSRDRYVVSVVRQDPDGDRATAFAPTDVARRAHSTIAFAATADDHPPVRATGVGLVVFEDRDHSRDVLVGRGRVSPTYHRGGAGAALRLEFQ
ncbi:MAG: PEGA domain-containing protein [Deltaproteobacteria bacterium]|nr:PEGA domain-containing protein [Deltaproteobacteria bacterium]